MLPTALCTDEFEPALFALVAASQPRTIDPLLLASTDIQPKLAQQWPLQSENDQPAQPKAISAPRPARAAQHARDVVFDEWSDAFVDVLIRASGSKGSS
jgi:hypothetical protein